MASPIPSSSSNEKRSILRRSPRHQTHELNAGATEHGSKKVGFAGFENISNEKISNLRRSPRNQTHVSHSGTTENEAKKVGFAGLKNVSNEKRSNLRQSPRHQTHEQNSGTTENGSKEVGFVGFQNISNEKSILRRSPRHQTHELNSGTTENGSKKVEFAGFQSINNEKRRILRRSPRNQTHELNDGTTENGSRKVNFTGFESISNEKKSILRRSPRHQSHELDSETTENESKNINKPADHGEHVLPKLGKVDMNNDLAKSSSKSPCEQNIDSSEVKGRRYPLRTSLGTARITQSMSKTENQHELVPKPLNLLRRRRRRRRRKKGSKVKKASKDEFLVIMKRVRYLLTRMNYEQNLIDAYSGEGWKGQSADKLRPEKELERAKSEILRRKFKIRELFRHLDSLSSEGRIEASLFDSEGQLNSEDIFCATCGSKDLSPDNDIILCDGLCDRGFHQKCLNPPLLSEDIPPGDEGWLCPACCCKIDCIKLLNELQGSNLSIKDTWEKIFPEAVAMTNEDKKRDDLPSNDSEDFDYGSDGSEVDFERLGSTSSSEDDSDDDDFDPNDSNVDKSVPKYGSSSDESNFKSDSAKFCIELRKTLRAKKDSAPSVRNLKPIADSGEGTCTVDICNSEIPYVMEPGLDQENMLTSGKRKPENFEFKLLSDGTYETSPSDSSEDENWSESADKNMPNRRKKDANRKEPYGPSNANTRTVKNYKNLNNVVGMPTEADMVRKSGINLPQVSHVHETTPSKTYPALDASAMEHVEHHGCPEPGSIKFSVSTSNSFSETARKKLCEIFQGNQYPTRSEKESLAQELGLTYQQVQRWFINSRHSFYSSTKEASPNEVPSASKVIAATNENTKCINEVGKDGQEAVARQLLEAYGISCSDSGGDEDWYKLVDMNMPYIGEEYANRKEHDVPTKGNARTVKSYENSENVVGMSSEVDAGRESVIDFPQVSHIHETAPIKAHPAPDTSAMDHVGHHGFWEPDSNQSSVSTSRSFGETTGKGLHESFQENQYLTWQNKESLSQVLGLTYQQEHGWFMNSHSICLSTNEAPLDGLPSPNKDNSATNENIRGINLNYSGGSISQMYATEGIKRKNPISDEQVNVRDEQCSMSEADKEREKAVARELRKMKKRR